MRLCTLGTAERPVYSALFGTLPALTQSIGTILPTRNHQPGFPGTINHQHARYFMAFPIIGKRYSRICDYPMGKKPQFRPQARRFSVPAMINRGRNINPRLDTPVTADERVRNMAPGTCFSGRIDSSPDSFRL